MKLISVEELMFQKKPHPAQPANDSSFAVNKDTTLRQMSWALSYPSSAVQDHFKRILTLAVVTGSGKIQG